MLMLMVETFRRFLRARKFELEPAYKQFTDTEKWRNENGLEELYRRIDIDQYEKTRRLVSPLIMKEGGKKQGADTGVVVVSTVDG
jgi:hypothetical protein